MRQQLSEAIKYWDHIAPVVKYPKNMKEFNDLVSQFDELLDIVGDNEKHHLIGLVDAISNIISFYEEQHHKNTTAKGIDALKFFQFALALILQLLLINQNIRLSKLHLFLLDFPAQISHTTDDKKYCI